MHKRTFKLEDKTIAVIETDSLSTLANLTSAFFCSHKAFGFPVEKDFLLAVDFQDDVPAYSDLNDF